MSARLDDLLAGIRAGNYHANGIRCLRLFTLERAALHALRADVDRLCGLEQGSDVRNRAHITNWTRPTGEVRQFSLLTRSGDFTDSKSDHDFSCVGKRFHHASLYPHLAAFIGQFGHAINFRINILGPGSRLAPHEEHSLFMSHAGTVAVRARFHLPIRTDRAAGLTLDGERFRFRVGVVYYFNQGCVHDAFNESAAPRVHMVWDMLLTEQSFALMFCDAAAPPGLRRFRPAEQRVRSFGRKPVGPFAKLPPLVTPLEAQGLTLCAIQ